MHTSLRLSYCFSILLWACAAGQTPLSTAFTYQGRLVQNGVAVNGTVNMAFTLWDDAGTGNPPAGGNIVGPVMDPAPVNVTNGLFTLQFDFGSVFNGDKRWLQINVDGTTLSPRQELTAAPYAVHALECNTAGYAVQAGYADAPWQTTGADLFYNAGNVGIGTSTPAAMLDVTGTIQLGSFLMPTGAAAGKVLTSDASGNGGWQNAPGLTLPYSGSAASTSQVFSITNTQLSGINNAARFESLSASGRAIFATAPGIGVFGQCTSGAGYGVYGSATSSTTFSTTYGVYGQAVSANSYGLYGNSTATTGSPAGVYGTSASATGYGVYGFNSYTGNDPNNSHIGGYFVCNAPGADAVYGASSGSNSLGVFGQGFFAGVGGYGPYGVEGTASIPGGYGVYSFGSFAATGTKSFQIDHPLDPENKYLSHYCTEGPEPYNAYSGNVVTDSRGEAWVKLPDYFGEINKDFRYTLTVVDDSDSAEFVQAKIAREIRDNRFKIRTSAPNVKVSWRVEALRNDRFVRAYGAPIEQDKPKEHRGKYLQPELYGKTKEMSQFHRPEHEPRRPSPDTAKPSGS